MGFYEDSSKRALVFRDTMNLCSENTVLSQAVAQSIASQKIYYDCETSAEKIFDTLHAENECAIHVTRNRTFQAAEKYVKTGKKVCVLNFASSTSPGGGVWGGAGAQEECLCRCSTFYPALEAVKKDFHDRHISLLKSGKMNGLYNDDIIFTPDVVVFKTDTVLPETRPQSQWYKVDVITCAAPNLRRRPEISAEGLFEIHKTRLEKILAVAAKHKAEVIVLGAFGCGAFMNPPSLVSKAEKEVILKYAPYFKEIEFAVFCPPHYSTNYEAFKRELG